MSRAPARDRPEALDVSELPVSGLDSNHLGWWGTVLMMAVESTMVALLLLIYFYVRKNFAGWPPPRVDSSPAILRPSPQLLIATTDMILLGLSVIPTVMADRIARRRATRSQSAGGIPRGPIEGEDTLRPRQGSRYLGLIALLAVVALVAVVLRWFEFHSLLVRWDANAYGSIVWSLLGIHLMYLMFGAAEFILLALWVYRYGLTEKLAADTTFMALSWYWTVAVWAVIYAVVFWSPRMA